jgi:hypothetical protein
VTNRFKDFGNGNAVDAKPLSFKLHDEEFHCVPSLQGKILLNLVVDSSSEDTTAAAQVITSFFEHVLLDESNVRFQALLVDKNKIVSVETLGEITGWLVEEYTNRPEPQPELSSPGQ